MELSQDGKAVGSIVTNRQGVATLCDAPVGLVDFEIGGKLCGAVSVKYLKAYWLQTRRVSVTYENCSGEEWAVPGGCLLTIRLEDRRNSPVAGAFFEDPNESPTAQTTISDQFGRIFRFIKFGETLSGRVIKDGYFPEKVGQECRAGTPPDREFIIVLREQDKTR